MDINEYVLLNTTGNLYWKDKQGRYLGCNLEFAKVVSLNSPQEIVGKTDMDFLLNTLGEEVAKKIIELDQYVISHNEERTCEEIGIDRGGNKAYYLTRKVPLRDNEGNVIGLMGNSINITEYKSQEEELLVIKEKMATAEAANKVRSEFLKSMGHDIRTPLAGITGFADTIKNETTEPKIKEYAANLVTSSNALSALLNSVLEAINVGSGEIPLLKKSFSLQEQLQEIILLNQAKAHQKGLELLFDYDSTIPQHLIGDPTRLHRIALELVTNALNFTEKGRVRLSAQLAKDNKENAIVKIVVEDTGIGIEPAKQQELYVRFKRFAPSYEGISKGFGLGLYVTKQFIDDLQGELYVESQIGVGSKFTAIIKLKKPLLGALLDNEGTGF